MSRHLYLLIVLCLLFASLTSTFALATAQPAAPTTAQAVPGAWETVWRGSGELAGFQCVTASTCFAVGDAGLFLKTTDAGATWHFEALPTRKNLRALAFGDANQGVAVGEDGVVLYTRDGGASWQAGASPGAVELLAVSMLPSGQAWAAGRGGSVFASADGGASWTPQVSGVTQDLHDIQFLDASRGWAVGDKATLLRTSNGGAAWTPVASPFPNWANMDALHFPSAQQGWAAGQAGNMIRTSDGGASWQAVATGLAIDILDVHFAGAFGVLGAAGGVIATRNGDDPWMVRAPGVFGRRTTNAVFAFGPTDVWAAGGLRPAPDTGARAWWIRHSRDGVDFARSAGDFGPAPHLEDVAFPATDVAYVAGHESSLGKTTDGGDTWAWQQITPVPDASDPFLLAISCSDVTHCWVGGRYGRLFATSDGGATWQPQTLPGVGRPIYDIQMLSAQLGQAGTNTDDTGKNATFYTTNGGQTWTAGITDGDNPMTEYAMVNPTYGWAALRNYSYRTTTNGGRNWKRIIDPTLAAGFFEAIDALDADANGQVDHVWLVGCMGKDCTVPHTGSIAYSENAGASWAFQPLPANTPALSGLFMFDTLHGWASGEQGTLLYTDNGGASWERVDSSLPAGDTAVVKLAFIDPARGLAAAHGGHIIRFTGPGRTLGSYSQPGAITVDGLAGDWYQGGALRLDATTASAVLGPDPRPDPADLSADVSSRWLGTPLYLLAEISDDDVTDDDSVQIALDGRDDNTSNGADDHLLTLTADGTLTDSLHPDQAGNIVARVSRTTAGWIAELGLPAALLGRSGLLAGDGIGFNLALNDDDGDGANHIMLLEGRRLDGNPATFGTIRLLGDTVTYREGSDGYTGGDDTYLERWTDQTGNTPRGAEENLKDIFNSQVYADMLLRFELAGLPQGAQVQQATLDLSVTARRLDAPLTIAAHRLLKSWDERTATWNRPASGQTWGSPGARQSGSDYDATALDAKTFSNLNVGDHVQWDVTAAAQSWLNQPDANFGVLLLPTAGARELWGASSEHREAAKRPQLTVRFALQARPATSTPTPTLSPTATPSATLTASPTATSAPTDTPTPTPSATLTASPTPTDEPTATATPSATPRATATPTATSATTLARLYLPLLQK